MAKHEVTCVACGRMFDSEQGGGSYDPKSRRYTCPECTARQREALAAELAKKLRKKFITKLVIGAILIIAGFASIGKPEVKGGVIICFIAGIALIAWALIPYFQMRKKVIDSLEEESSDQNG